MCLINAKITGTETRRISYQQRSEVPSLCGHPRPLQSLPRHVHSYGPIASTNEIIRGSLAGASPVLGCVLGLGFRGEDRRWGVVWAMGCRGGHNTSDIYVWAFDLRAGIYTRLHCGNFRTPR